MRKNPITTSLASVGALQLFGLAWFSIGVQTANQWMHAVRALQGAAPPPGTSNLIPQVPSARGTGNRVK